MPACARPSSSKADGRSRTRTRPRAIADDGHLVGNHSHYHARMPLARTTTGCARTRRRRGRDPSDDRRRPAAVVPLSVRRRARRPPGPRGPDELGYRNVHWDVEVEDWEPWRTGAAIARDVVEGVRDHGDGAVVLLHTWPGGTGDAIERDPRRAPRRREQASSRSTSWRRCPVTRAPALLAVDGGGSKIDVALLRRDGTVLGAARVATTGLETAATKAILAQIGHAVADGGRGRGASTPTAGRSPTLGVFCLAGADLPADDRRIARGLAADGGPDRSAAQRHVRGPPRRDRPRLGRRAGLRLGDELLGGRPRRPDLPVPGDGRDLGGLGRRRRARRDGAVARDPRRGRPRASDRAASAPSPRTSG